MIVMLGMHALRGEAMMFALACGSLFCFKGKALVKVLAEVEDDRADFKPASFVELCGEVSSLWLLLRRLLSRTGTTHVNSGRSGPLCPIYGPSELSHFDLLRHVRDLDRSESGVRFGRTV